MFQDYHDAYNRDILEKKDIIQWRIPRKNANKYGIPRKQTITKSSEN